MLPRAHKGRGATLNPEGRFERFAREAVDDGWGSLKDLAEAPAPTTEVLQDRARTIIARNDSYGVGLRDDASAALKEAGVDVVEMQTYDEGAQTFDAEVQALKGANPDAVLVIAFEEASRIVTTMIENGIGPQDVQVYGTDGFIGDTFGENFDAGK